MAGLCRLDGSGQTAHAGPHYQNALCYCFCHAYPPRLIKKYIENPTSAWAQSPVFRAFSLWHKHCIIDQLNTSRAYIHKEPTPRNKKMEISLGNPYSSHLMDFFRQRQPLLFHREKKIIPALLCLPKIVRSPKLKGGYEQNTACQLISPRRTKNQKPCDFENGAGR